MFIKTPLLRVKATGYPSKYATDYLGRFKA